MRNSLIASFLRCPVLPFRRPAAMIVMLSVRCRAFLSVAGQHHRSLPRGGPSDLQERSQEVVRNRVKQYCPTLGWSAAERAEETDNFLFATKAIPSFFSDKVVIDAGCGNGRYINILNSITTPPPRLIIGVDLVGGVVLAARTARSSTNVVFLRIDLNVLPLMHEGTVDYVYSIGVLHHTPDAA